MTKGNEKRRIETREKILETANEIFSQKGYHNTQIMDIVNAIGMSAGTVYTHFKNKKKLFEEVADKDIEQLRLTLKEMRQTEQAGDMAARLGKVKNTYGAFFDYIEKHPQQLLLILRGGFGIDEQMDSNTWRYFSSFAHDLAEDFVKWEKFGIISGFNPILLGHIIVGMSLHAGHSYLVEKKFTRQEAIDTLALLNIAMFYVYLTEKGKAALGFK
jgi:AcrR family transcriptional regulator